MKIALAAALFSVCSIAYQANATAQSDGGFPNGVLAAPGGRFVFGQVNRMARDQYMLDTQTGRLWQIACVKMDDTDKSKCAATALEAVAYTADGRYSNEPPRAKLAP